MLEELKTEVCPSIWVRYQTRVGPHNSAMKWELWPLRKEKSSGKRVLWEKGSENQNKILPGLPHVTEEIGVRRCRIAYP